MHPIFHDSPEHWQPAITVRASEIYLYDLYQKDHKKGVFFKPKSNKNEGLLSAKSQSRIRKYTELLFDASKSKRVFQADTQKVFWYKLGFATLTLPSEQIHTDNEIFSKCFKPFIRSLKKKYPSFLYIYKAEVQDNGNLHFHFTTNTFIHYAFLQDHWNYWVNKLGYVTRSRSDSPHSTEIKCVKNHETLAKYMSKYLTKKDMYTKVLSRYHRRYKKVFKECTDVVCRLPNNYFNHIKRRVTVKIWDCSTTLKQAILNTYLDDEIFWDLYDKMRDAQTIFEHDTCRGIQFDKVMRKQCPNICKFYSNALKDIRYKTKLQSAEIVI